MANNLELLERPRTVPDRKEDGLISFERVDRKFVILETMSAEVSALIMRVSTKRSRRVDRQLIGYR